MYTVCTCTCSQRAILDLCLRVCLLQERETHAARAASLRTEVAAAAAEWLAASRAQAMPPASIGMYPLGDGVGYVLPAALVAELSASTLQGCPVTRCSWNEPLADCYELTEDETLVRQPTSPDGN